MRKEIHRVPQPGHPPLVAEPHGNLAKSPTVPFPRPRVRRGFRPVSDRFLSRLILARVSATGWVGVAERDRASHGVCVPLTVSEQ